MSPDFLIPLEHLRPGQWGEVLDISGEPSWVGRMAEMGIRVGIRLRMLRDGSPCLIQLGEGRLSLRGEGVMQVLVRPLEQE